MALSIIIDVWEEADRNLEKVKGKRKLIITRKCSLTTIMILQRRVKVNKEKTSRNHSTILKKKKLLTLTKTTSIQLLLIIRVLLNTSQES